jgi:hypothetical protein
MIARSKTPRCANKACRQRFTPPAAHPRKLACCEGCEIILTKQHLAKVQAARVKAQAKKGAADRKETKAKIQALKGLSYGEGRAQHAVNKYVRLRDDGQGCISCGITYSTVWQAGHFIAVGANSTLRYVEDNIHLQCVQCNMNKSGNVGPYRIRLIAKIGIERVEALEAWHAPVKSTVEQCQAIEALYKAKTKALLAERELNKEAA